MIYNIMRKDTLLAIMNDEDGAVTIHEKLPIGLKLKDTGNIMNITERIQNVAHFKSWCAGRTLMMSQKHAKKICNALALSQDINEDNKSKIALSYSCSTLQDAFWVKEKGSLLAYKDVSLFQNKSHNILTPVSLKGQASVFNKRLKNWVDIGTDGTLAKSWIRENEKYYLLKENTNSVGEILASQIGIKLGMNCVHYTEAKEFNLCLTKCECFTNENYGFIPYNLYVKEYGNKAIEHIKEMFMTDYANLVVFTYLTGNEDLHNKNWGLKINNNTGEIVGLSPVFDFDGCFLSSYKASKNLRFLPECSYIDKDSHSIQYFNDFDMDADIIITGPTIEEAIQEYAKYSSISFNNELLTIIPNEFKEEFSNRIDIVNNLKRDAIIKDHDELIELN